MKIINTITCTILTFLFLSQSIADVSDKYSSSREIHILKCKGFGIFLDYNSNTRTTDARFGFFPIRLEQPEVTSVDLFTGTMGIYMKSPQESLVKKIGYKVIVQSHSINSEHLKRTRGTLFKDVGLLFSSIPLGEVICEIKWD